jgi:transcriptional regulator with XRE-family HTH domain
MENYGENIRKYRISSNMSQEQLAERLNVSRQAVSKWELNETEPDLSKVVKMSELFGISVDEMLGKKAAGYNAESGEHRGEIRDWLERKGYLVIGIIMTFIGAVPLGYEISILVSALYESLTVPGSLFSLGPVSLMISTLIFLVPILACFCFGIHFIRKHIKLKKKR